MELTADGGEGKKGTPPWTLLWMSGHGLIFEESKSELAEKGWSMAAARETNEKGGESRGNSQEISRRELRKNGISLGRSSLIPNGSCGTFHQQDLALLMQRGRCTATLSPLRLKMCGESRRVFSWRRTIEVSGIKKNRSEVQGTSPGSEFLKNRSLKEGSAPSSYGG